MPITPHKGETQDDFIGRCMRELETSETNRPQDQKLAICFGYWKEAHGGKADNTPYGDVEYADPGFQKDGKKRYPIDTEEHIRAAWSYINKPENQSPYTAEQVSHIKNKIIAAWKSKIDPAGPPSAKSKQGLIPDEDETPWEFMDRCIASGEDEQTCRQIWQDEMGDADMSNWSNQGRVVHKTIESKLDDGMNFVLSDATPDRFDDVIDQNGWDLANFLKNPISLFNHNKDFVIGKWEGLRVADGALKGKLKFAPAGTSERIDEIRKLVDAGILRAVSVGFRPISYEPRKGSNAGGQLYTKSELVETSLVAIPANPNALAIAKQLDVSAETLNLVFAEHGARGRRGVGGPTGKNADTTRSNERRGNMTPLATRIKDTETRIVQLKDKLAEHLGKIDDENPDETAATVTAELNAKIDQQETLLVNLKSAEKHIMTSAAERHSSAMAAGDGDSATTTRATTHFPNGGSSALDVNSGRPFAVPGKKVVPLDYMIRSIVVMFKHHCEKGRRTMDQIMIDEYGEDITTRAVMNYVTRAASTPATTTGSGWVDTLIQTMIGELVQALTAVSIFPRLAAMGSSYTFDRNSGKIILPVRTGGNLGGGFVAEGSPIPVKAGAFTSVTLTPKKLGVITTMTRQAANYSTPALEGIVRDGIIQDTAVALDTVLMDNTAASAVRPQGMQNAGGSALGGSAAAIAGLISDLKGLVGALITGTAGNIRRPAWIMSPGDVLAASLTQAAAGGDLPFRDELGRGQLLGFPVLQSTTGTTDQMYLIDAADFISSVGAPQFDVSDQAVLHMEDTNPAALATGTGPTVATPIRSLYQTDSMAIRLLWDLDWAFRRANIVKWQSSLGWN